MKQLTQEVFDSPDCPDWAESAAVNANGLATWFDEKWQHLDIEGEWWGYAKNFQRSVGFRHAEIGHGYDTTNWENSAINKASKPVDKC